MKVFEKSLKNQYNELLSIKPFFSEGVKGLSVFDKKQ